MKNVRAVLWTEMTWRNRKLIQLGLMTINLLFSFENWFHYYFLFSLICNINQSSLELKFTYESESPFSRSLKCIMINYKMKGNESLRITNVCGLEKTKLWWTRTLSSPSIWLLRIHKIMLIEEKLSCKKVFFIEKNECCILMKAWLDTGV